MNSADIADKKLFAAINGWFEKYTRGFIHDQDDVNDPLKIKQVHSIMVSRECGTIARNLFLDKHDIKLAEIIGLLHDIGRFDQYRDYQTFKDSESTDHGLLGCHVLEKENLSCFFNKEDFSIIKSAIANHNKASIEKNIKNKKLLFCKITRDADKLDIWRVLTEYYRNSDKNSTLEMDLSNDPDISKNVLSSIRGKELVNLADLKTLNDFKLLQISWIFDLNFSHSLQELIQRRYLHEIFDSMPQTKQIEDLKKIIMEHLYR